MTYSNFVQFSGLVSSISFSKKAVSLTKMAIGKSSVVSYEGFKFAWPV